jgi:hypothetical protein
LGWGSQGVALGSTTAMPIVCGIVLPIHCAKAGQLGCRLSAAFTCEKKLKPPM